MSIDVTFLGQAYSFGDDLKEYVDSLRLSEKITDNLVNSFLSLSKRKGGIIDAADIRPDLIRKADEYIKKLCSRGIFSKSAEDYVEENDGYKAIQQICADGVSVYSKILIDEINEFQDGMNDAYSDAASNITGTGVRVYTSSLATLALNSAYEYSVLKGQAKKADEQYKKAINELSDRTEAKSDRRKNEYLKNTYYPRMTDALTLFAFGLVQRYISDLITEGKFDDSVLKNAEIKKSNTLLDNLKHITDHNSRLECIKQAFEACPFNESVFDTIVEYGLFSSNEASVLKSFKLDSEFCDKLSRYIITDSIKNLKESIENKQYYIQAFADCKGISHDEAVIVLSKNLYDDIISKYAQIIDIKSPDNTIIQDISDMGDTDFLAFSDNDLRKMIYLKISSIISKDDFESFVNLTGNFKIYNELGALINIIPKENNKAEIDRCYEDYIFSILTDRIHKEQSNTSDKLAHDRQIREHNKLEDEIRISKLKKRIIITTSLVIGVIACVFITVGIVIPNVKYNQAEDLYNQGKYNQALDVYESLGTYKYSQLRIQDIKHKQDYIKSITTGMSFYYGKYEQDGNQGNGNEDIEWIVLDRKDDNLFVLSVYGLDYMPYNDKWGDISWANCSLRNWLNEKFINEAFTDEESAQIIEVDLDNSDYGKAATKDKLFVLSKSEWIKYNQAYYKLQFKSNYVNQCIKNKEYEKPVIYAWWLRSPGLMDNYAMSIEEAGGGCDVNEANYANIVRPAMWIKVE